jgi:hypothetical protein
MLTEKDKELILDCLESQTGLKLGEQSMIYYDVYAVTAAIKQAMEQQETIAKSDMFLIIGSAADEAEPCVMATSVHEKGEE